ncbi:glycosyltransferase family 2 protein [Bacillus haikouensis]|nr:glycosyltransferase family 2 protein [Bacillus haikouensis]
MVSYNTILNRNEDLVSVIMPTYNSSNYINETIKSVLNQTYHNWELIVVDDCSTDNTCEIVKSFIKEEPRIKYFKLEINSGAAIARNKAVELAGGHYMAFLDSDDIWFPDKLNKQITFMKNNNYNFSCTSYTKIDEYGKFLNQVIEANKISDYEKILKNNPGNSTVVYNSKNLGKFIIPNIKKRNDYVMWLQVIKAAKHLYGIQEPLGSHRIRLGSLSNKKTNLIMYHWKVYRDIESLSVFKSFYLIIYWIFKTIFKTKLRRNIKK